MAINLRTFASPRSALRLTVVVLMVTAGLSPMAAAQTGTISGMVTDTAGPANPLDGVQVKFYNGSGLVEGTCSSALDGTYLSPELPVGTYYVQVDDQDWANELYSEMPCQGCVPVEGTPVVVAAGQTTPGIDFTLVKGGTITGTVTDMGSGEPIVGVGPQINLRTLDHNGGPYTGGYFGTDAEGRFSTTDDLVPGVYSLFVIWVSGYASEAFDDIPLASYPWYRYTGTGVVVTSGATTDIDIQLGPGVTVNGRVTEEGTGTGLADIRVTAQSAFTTTDVDGYYTLSNISPGSFFVGTSSAQYLTEYYAGASTPGVPTESFAMRLTGTHGQVVEPVDFELKKGGCISGTVTDAGTGEPVALSLAIYNETGRRIWGVSSTVPDGQYTSWALPSGTYYVRVRGDDYYGDSGYLATCYGEVSCPWLTQSAYLDENRGTPIEVTAPDCTSGIDFSVAKGGQIAGRVVREGTSYPLRGYIRIFDSENRYLDFVRTDTDGYYESQVGLPSGTYFVVASTFYGYVTELYDVGASPSCALSSSQPQFFPCDATLGTPVEVTAGATTTGIDFGLMPGGAIAGVFTDTGSGERLAYRDVRVHDAAGNLVAEEITDPAGHYVTGTIPEGTYYVNGGTSYYGFTSHVDVTYGTNVPCGIGCVPSAATPVTVTAGSVTEGVDFALTTGALISGSVTYEATGLPYWGMECVLYDASGVQVTLGVSDREGSYRTNNGVPDGTYYMKTNSRSPLIDKVWDDMGCAESGCDPTTGTPIVITGGVDVSGIDFVIGEEIVFADGFESGNTSKWLVVTP